MSVFLFFFIPGEAHKKEMKEWASGGGSDETAHAVAGALRTQ